MLLSYSTCQVAKNDLRTGKFDRFQRANQHTEYKRKANYYSQKPGAEKNLSSKIANEIWSLDQHKANRKREQPQRIDLINLTTNSGNYQFRFVENQMRLFGTRHWVLEYQLSRFVLILNRREFSQIWPLRGARKIVRGVISIHAPKDRIL